MIAGILLTIWSANKGMKALMNALNIVYDEEESRGLIKLNAISLLFTFCAIVMGLLAISLVIAVPALIGFLNLPVGIQALVTYLRWPRLEFFSSSRWHWHTGSARTGSLPSGAGFLGDRFRPRFYGSSFPCCFPSMWPISAATVKLTAPWER